MIAGVLGTWAIAALAIWGDTLRSRFFKPVLHIEKDGFSGTVGTHQNGHKARYYNIRVKNRKRQLTLAQAHEVQVVLTRIEKSGSHGPEVLFDEMMPLPWLRGEYDRLLTRTVGSDGLAQLFFVQDDGILGITPAIPPNGMLLGHFPREHTGRSTLWVTLRAVSIEADSPPIRLKIEWSGTWHAGKAEIEDACPVVQVQNY
jgi:hypothetical protein